MCFKWEVSRSVRVGLFLGMGPIAGAHFYKKFTEAFSGLSDYQHPTVISYSNPTEPQTSLGEKTDHCSLSPALRQGLDFFRKCNVDFIVAPCNTLMYFRSSMEEYSKLPIVDIVGEVVTKIKRQCRNARKIGLMSTPETVKWRLYHNALSSMLSDIEVIELDTFNQAEVDAVIRDVKLGMHLKSRTPTERLIKVVENLANRGAEVIIEGCTELPCALEPNHRSDIVLIDSSQVLADAGARLVQDFNQRKRTC